MIKKRTIIAIGLIIIIISSLTIYYLYPCESERNINICEFERDINSGMSIMGLWPHPDDEVYTPGIFPLAASKGNTCWVVHLVGLDYIPEQAQEPRRQAIQWFRETYLWPNGGDCINLNMPRGEGGGWHGWYWSNETIKAAYKAQIEEKQPDILLTFTPYGACDKIEHGLISDMVTEIWHELTYEPKPKIFWFINTDQGPRPETCEEHKRYPPDNVLDLDVYSDTLGMTYWEAKVEFWWKYAPSIGALDAWLKTPGELEGNDRKEYYMRHK